MNATEFAEENHQAKVLLIGESHDDPNVEMVLAIVKTFEDRGHNLAFYFEHFPGQDNLHKQLSSGDITPETFIKTPATYPGASGPITQTPEDYWGHPEQSGKLVTLMTFAQQRFIQIKGHDLIQTDFSSDGFRDWLSRRDLRMVDCMLVDCRKSRFGMAVGFVGRMHVAPQAKLLRESLAPDTVVTLTPDAAIAPGQIFQNMYGHARDYLFRSQ